jgi:Carboxypeptidase regulatory-like domain/TonB dependent receptor
MCFLALRAYESGAPAKYLDRLGQTTRTTGILGKRGGLRVKDKLRSSLQTFFVSQFALAILILCFGAQLSFAQTEKASVSGRVTDQNNAALVDAEVQIRNTDTNIVASVRTNGEGIYVIPSLNPGSYVMNINKQGFRAVSVTGLTLSVQDNLSRNFVLQIGSTAESVTVTAESTEVQTTSSDLGTVINEKAIHELPLNGRSFSQLLTLTPGATPISTSQSSGVGVNDLDNLGVPTASVAQPAIQGQWNRSNLYLLDGVINTELNTSAFIMPPIIDAMQEFKVQSHDDQAEYGSVLGGVVNVVTRSGTNQLHGAAWEFDRNNFFDARDHFKDEFRTSPAAFRQNQFGGIISGPVFLPKLYDGRNRTFFTFAYEGWRFSQASQIEYTVPTNAELGGDFSNSTLTNPIYDPATTQPDPNNPGKFIRTQFVSSSNPGNTNYNPACTVAAGCPNMIPINRIDTTMLKFIQTYYARPNLVGGGVLNAFTSQPHIDNSNHYNFRIDEQIGGKDNVFFRYDRLNVVDIAPFDVSGYKDDSVPALNIGVGWTHVFTSSLLLENRVGRAQRPFTRDQLDTHGLAPMLALGFKSPGGTLITLAAPFGGGVLTANPGEQTANTIESPVTSFSHGLTWIHRGHQFKVGFEYFKQGNDSDSPPYGGYEFADSTTGHPEQVGTTGSSLASALLGLPAQLNNTTTLSIHNRVSTWASYFQDQWKLRRNLTLTYGLRFDHRRPFGPSSGTLDAGPNSDGHWWIGADKLPPPCSQTGVSPCIPGNGTLASIPNGDKIQLSPYGRAWGPAPEWDDWGPRLGIAWEATPKMVVRGGYGIVYDPLTGIEQDWKGLSNFWPATGSGFTNAPTNQLGQPLTTVEQTFSTVGTRLPDPSPWNQTSWFMDPHHQDARSQQWNVEIQRQMGANLAASVGYVGSKNDRLDLTGLFNTAQTPGPGTPAQVNARRPFPWYNVTPFFGTSHGTGNYNALQVKLDRKFANSFQYLVSYTWSKSIDTGSSGWFDVENGSGGGAFSGFQNYYDPNGSRSVSSYDIPHFLSMSGVWDLPFGRGKRYLSQGIASQVLGNWQLNGIVQLRSGQPYNLAVTGDVANIGNTLSFVNYARPNIIGDPTPAHQTVNEWFNPSAFAVPSFSYGDFGRNGLRSASVYDADFSVFKNFPIGERFLVSFRAEFFNAFNIQNYSAPSNTVIGVAGAGQVTSNVLPPREMQFGLHLSF